MSQAEATKLIPKLRYNLKARRNLKNPEGPQGRHNKIRKVVTALFKHERIELNYNKGDEARGYAERLISEAIRNGDRHQPTMEMASYWIIEKQIVHKLFKVLAPRYQNSTLSYTKMWKAPRFYPSSFPEKCVLELRGNIYPKLGIDNSYNRNLIHNVLLSAAREDFYNEKLKKIVTPTELQTDLNESLKTESLAESHVDNADTETVKEVKMSTTSELNAELNENVKTDSLADSHVADTETNSEKQEAKIEETVDSKLTDKSDLGTQVEKDLNIGDIKITEEELTEKKK